MTTASSIRAGTYALTAVNGAVLPYQDTDSGSKLTAGICVIRADATFIATLTLVGGSAAGAQQVSGVFTPISDQRADVVFSTGTRAIAALTPTGFTAPVGPWILTFTKQ